MESVKAREAVEDGLRQVSCSCTGMYSVWKRFNVGMSREVRLVDASSLVLVEDCGRARGYSLGGRRLIGRRTERTGVSATAAKFRQLRKCGLARRI